MLIFTIKDSAVQHTVFEAGNTQRSINCYLISIAHLWREDSWRFLMYTLHLLKSYHLLNISNYSGSVFFGMPFGDILFKNQDVSGGHIAKYLEGKAIVSVKKYCYCF